MRSLPPLATKDRALSAVLVIGCGVVQAASLAVAAFATRDAFAALHLGQNLALRTMIALAAAGCLVAICLFLSRRFAEGLGQSYAISLRHVLYEQIAKLPKSRHEQRRLGALSLRFVGDLSAARLWFGRGLPDVMTALIVLPGAVAILFLLDVALALAGLVPLAVALLAMVGLARHLGRRHKTLRRRRASIAIAMIERIAIAPELDLMGRTDKELRALDAQGAELRQDAVARRSRTTGLQALLQTGAALSGLAILWQASRSGIAPSTVAASLSVLALVALPLQDLAAAWDRFCAWRVARGKALAMLAEPTVERVRTRGAHGPAIAVSGTVDGQSVRFEAEAAQITTLTGPWAQTIARHIAGLDCAGGLHMTADGVETRPPANFIGDTHVGLQGSLRRSACLGARKRPKDTRVTEVLTAFGLKHLLDHPRGLDQRTHAGGQGLTAAETLRLDLARAVLSEAAIIVIASTRWAADPDQDLLLAILADHTAATVILVNDDRAATSLTFLDLD